MPPNVDKATEMGIMTENIPSSFSPNVCSRTFKTQFKPGITLDVQQIKGNLYVNMHCVEHSLKVNKSNKGTIKVQYAMQFLSFCKAKRTALLTTATALDDSSSSGDMAEK